MRVTQQTVTKTSLNSPLYVELATTAEAVYASKRLRYQVFAQEQGAILPSATLSIDEDYFDAFCEHLLVRHAATGEVVGSTRILTMEAAKRAGGFYSGTEFELQTLMPNLQGNAIEIGRTCIHPAYRNGAGIGTLWVGLAQYMQMFQVNYLFGCASIALQDQGAHAAAIMQYIQQQHLAPAHLRVSPKIPLHAIAPTPQFTLPPLLKAYLKLGAWVAGDACIDTAFNVADVFILLDIQRLNTRYHAHFMKNCQPPVISHAA